ncbi:MAG: hypothetical protein COT71_01010 [Candidatus Andersenbacteria bacterium CG10_big_fil_rev_8_21_14_0_10_54_11]|uniref:CDP-archaeol synthase n=1 Tax=Candidatus Andersenbacteria bacterium CG10_big_fil_rev_8_21_14_0_10_54_11 TaxID=1974485 RepID=A0A2M6X059_9BACT|nr:MAG: hypothetical protein COT71_01010 [Candidatus Andersenbacteria bacterium CG10_big_fil_rev_8_21_14_0_10_54_11]
MFEIFTTAIRILWLLLPAMAANMAPVFAATYNLFPALNRPLDGGVKWQTRRLLGKNKTIRGLLAGAFAGLLVGGIQGAALRGLLMGIGALTGDAAKSFAKRRLNISPGTSWKPWDQIDFVIGAIAFTIKVYPYTLREVVIALLVIGSGSYLVSKLGVALNVKQRV